MIIFIETT